jgi:hypothetical protein
MSTGQPITPPGGNRAPRTISSAQTFLAKFIVPVFWAGIFAMRTVSEFWSGQGHNYDMDRPFWYFGVIALIIFCFCVRLKRVRMDDHALYVSNYRTEITVPLSNVAEVSGSRWVNNQQVTIRFHSATVFGSQIVFIPWWRPLGFWSIHPVVGEIRDAVARANGKKPC